MLAEGEGLITGGEKPKRTIDMGERGATRGHSAIVTESLVIPPGSSTQCEMPSNL